MDPVPAGKPRLARGTGSHPAQRMARGSGAQARVVDPAYEDLITRLETRDPVTRKRPNEKIEVTYEGRDGQKVEVRGQLSNVVRGADGEIQEFWVTQSIAGADAEGAKVTHLIPMNRVSNLQKVDSFQEGNLLKVTFNDGRGVRTLQGQVVGVTRDTQGRVIDFDLELPRSDGGSKGLAWRIKAKDVRKQEEVASIQGDLETYRVQPVRAPEPTVLSTQIIRDLQQDLRARGIEPLAAESEDITALLADLRVKPEAAKKPIEVKLDREIAVADIERDRGLRIEIDAAAAHRAVNDLEEEGLKAETDALIASLPVAPPRPRAPLPPPYKGWKPRNVFIPEEGHVVLGKWHNGGLTANPDSLEVRPLSPADPKALPIQYPKDFESRFADDINQYLTENYGPNPFAQATVKGLERKGPRQWAQHLLDNLEKKLGKRAAHEIQIRQTGTSSFYDHYQLSAPAWVEAMPGWPKDLTINVVKDDIWELGGGAAEKIALKDVALSHASDSGDWRLPAEVVVATPAHIADGISFSPANPSFTVGQLEDLGQFRLSVWERDALQKRLGWLAQEKNDFDSFASPYVTSRTKMKLVARSKEGAYKDVSGLGQVRPEDVVLVPVDEVTAARAIHQDSDPWMFHVTNAQGKKVWVRMQLPMFR